VSKRDVIQSHVESLMEEILQVDDLVITPAGEIPVRHHSAVYNVRVSAAPNTAPHVEVYAVAVEDVDPDPGLYEALNTINRRASHARTFHSNRTIVVASELYGPTLSRDELECSCDEVALIAHVEGPRLAATYGGTVAYPDHTGEGE
jgi:hypothetical protein